MKGMLIRNNSLDPKNSSLQMLQRQMKIDSHQDVLLGNSEHWGYGGSLRHLHARGGEVGHVQSTSNQNFF